MLDRFQNEWRSLVSFARAGGFATPEFLKALLIPTTVLVGLVMVERAAGSFLLPNRGLAFLFFIPIWMATKMGNRKAGIIVALATACLIQVGAPTDASPLAIVVNFALLSCVTIVFYQFEISIANSKRMATTDGLTGILTRRGFMQEARRAIVNLRLNNETGALILFDCDRFKQINDRFGHARGDEALRIIAKALNASVQEGDVVARLGGDEFIVLLTATDKVGANVFLSRARQKVQELSQEFPESLRMSAGIALFPAEARDLPTLIDIADEKMFRQKRARNGYSQAVVESVHPVEKLQA